MRDERTATRRLPRCEDLPPSGRKGRLAVVSYLAHAPYEARGIRTRAILDALAARWDVDLVAGPEVDRWQRPGRLMRAIRYARYEAQRTVALDRAEIWSVRQSRRWISLVEGALLIGYPFSPVIAAARRLSTRGIPFVVDASDPWAITADRNVTYANHHMRSIAFRRACAAERQMWSTAAGAIVTTWQHERVLKQLFPSLRTLVRPNGFRAEAGAVTVRQPRDRSVLRIGHFGNLYAPRVGMGRFFQALVESGRWNTVVLEHFGGDWNRTLSRMPRGVEILIHDPVPWAEVLSLCRDLDAALVVGNIGGMQLPSKVVDYLTLPIPRIAVVERQGADAITDYVVDKPGWLVLGEDEPNAAERLAIHLDRPWDAASLAPPPSESWSSVGQQVEQFLAACLARAGARVGQDDKLVVSTSAPGALSH